jgi:hypothetical protein
MIQVILNIRSMNYAEYLIYDYADYLILFNADYLIFELCCLPKLNRMYLCQYCLICHKIT